MAGKGEAVRCDQCGEVFEKGWSDEEAAAERDRLFSPRAAPFVIVCEDCFERLMRVQGLGARQ